jgi:hypothetical protein
MDLSGGFGAPDNIKAVLLYIAARDSATWGTSDLFVAFGPSATYYDAAVARPAGGDVWASGPMVVPCNAAGNIYVQVNASGTLTMDVYVRIYGYWI